MNVKKIIAREGLVILSLLILTAIAFRLKHFQETWVMSMSDEAVARHMEKIKIIDDIHVICKEGKGHQFFWKPSNREIVEACFKLDDPRRASMFSAPYKTIIEGVSVASGQKTTGAVFEWHFFFKINFQLVALFFLLVAYPLYLLIRFIIWAIKTLRAK